MMNKQFIPQMVRPIPINPAQLSFNLSTFSMFPLKLEIPQHYEEENRCSSSGSNSEAPIINSTASSSRCSSTESANKIRRGRPQQEIEDGSDAHSQKKRHRRLYARQYRAQMRQKVENVKSLSDEKEALELETQKLRQQVIALKQELAQKDFLLNILQLPRV